MHPLSSGDPPASRLAHAARCITVVAAAALLGCTPKDTTAGDQVRGTGLEPATMEGAEQAGVLGVALRAAFDIGPSLTLLLDPAVLPRTRGYAGGDTLAMAVQRALRDSIVQGLCAPVAREDRAPLCEAAAPGYVVRSSVPFQMTGDTLLLYVMAERYDTPASGRHPRFRFETAYQLLRRGRAWTVVRQARLSSS